MPAELLAQDGFDVDVDRGGPDAVARATSGASTVTQIAFPDATNAAVYGTGVYASRGSNPIRNAADGIFADSLASELASVSGDPASGRSASFTKGVAV